MKQIINCGSLTKKKFYCGEECFLRSKCQIRYAMSHHQNGMVAFSIQAGACGLILYSCMCPGISWMFAYTCSTHSSCQSFTVLVKTCLDCDDVCKDFVDVNTVNQTCCKVESSLVMNRWTKYTKQTNSVVLSPSKFCIFTGANV